MQDILALTSDIRLVFTLIAVAATAFLGVIVALHNSKSFTNRIFIAHAFVGVAWSLTNYFSLVASPENALYAIRFVLFFAVPYVFLFLLFVKSFPEEKIPFRKTEFFALLGLMVSMMILAISPWVFSSLKIVGDVVTPQPGILMPIFGPLLVLFFLISFWLVLKKYSRAEGVIKRQWISIGTGLIVAYSILIFFVFVRVIVFGDTTFVPYSPLFILPIFVGAAYAILKHHLFSMKVVATEILTFALTGISLFQFVVAETPLVKILNLLVLGFFVYFGTLLIKSVLREVEQREQLEKLTEELKVANTKLEDLSRFKTQLLSLASHQIKAPLATIKQFGSLITDGIYGQIPDKVRETVGRMRYSADQLLALINDLLDLRKVEEGRMEYKFEKTDLKKMVNDVVEMNRVTATTSEKKLELTYAQPQGDVFVNADGQKLRQVVQNLVDNAIKYTNEGFVRVSLKIEGTDALVSVQDSGYGIPAVLLPQLFEEFVRDERVKKQIRGTGLGLFIARKILEAHAGKLWATSEGEGKGSTFFARLPLAK